MISPDDRFEKIKELVRTLSGDADADLILFSGPMVSPADARFLRHAKQLQSHKNVVLILTTFGGSGDSAYRIGRCLQRVYRGGTFTLLVHSYCKSAGTLLALGADRIVMFDGAELGPLDIQLSKPDELAEYTSGLTFKQAMETLRDEAFATLETAFLSLRFKSGLQITTKTALDISVRMATGLFAPIFEQIDPSRIGENQRAIEIAREYGRRLEKRNLKEETIEHLIGHYPSHGFVIDRDEAADLFREVREPNATEINLLELLEPLVDEGLDSDEPAVVFLNSVLYNVDEEENGENDDNDQNGSVAEAPNPMGEASSSEKPKERESEAAQVQDDHDKPIVPGSAHES